MKHILVILATVFLLSGCLSTSLKDAASKIDPVDTGEIIGFTYLMTKEELSESNREAVEKAYAIFTDVVNSDVDLSGETIDLKGMLFDRLDKKMSDPEDAPKKAVIKLVISRYWNRVDAKYDIDVQIPTKQMAILKQVHLGIERGLGRG